MKDRSSRFTRARLTRARLMQARLTKSMLQAVTLSPVATMLVQAFLFGFSGLTAFLLRFEFNPFGAGVRQLAVGICVWVLVKSLIFHLYRLDRGWWRFVSIPDLVRIASANVIASLAGAGMIMAAFRAGFPRSLYFLDLLICLMTTAGVRVLARISNEKKSAHRFDPPAEQTVIYGAGAAGSRLLREIRSNPQIGYSVCGFLDDDPSKRGVIIHGIPVLGSGAELEKSAQLYDVQCVLIAVPSANGTQMARILQSCQKAEVKCKTVPSLGDVIHGRGLVGQIRDVAVEDLLGRDPARLETSKISTMLTGKTVVITGAAGSIGSELCRQIARFSPRAIVGYDISETALFHLELEMQEAFPGVNFVPEIGSIQNRARLSETFLRHMPDALYHAAAYKHVPMMESQIFEAVENNVLGTWNVATAAAEANIGVFVMISSDKAVRPTNIMGCTKRMAELLINSMQSGDSKFVSVRFGNVLGSNGSVVPIFKRQIASGGPVKVTHPDMRRYFMTIPEAAQLVLQASAMSHGGEIFVLEMGEPVRILDLATNLIRLSGLTPHKDIAIEFTGTRPGEKMYEELSGEDENTRPTYHEKIKIFSGPPVSFYDMERRLQNIQRQCSGRDLHSLLIEIKDLVPEYNPSAHVLRQIPEMSLIAAMRAIGKSHSETETVRDMHLTARS